MNDNEPENEIFNEDPFATFRDGDGNTIYESFDQDIDLINDNLGWD